jgi:general L-amino acid transport system substrate-binding protein
MKFLFRTRLFVRLVGPAYVVLLALVCMPHPARAGETFTKIRATGVVRCGISEGDLAGFSQKNAQGRWTGLNVDFCRAVAVAALGDAEKVDFVPLRAAARFLALKSGEVDLLLRNTTWTLEREAGLGVHFVGTLFYDAQKVMVRQNNKVSHVAELNGATICMEKGTNHDENLAGYFRARALTYQLLLLDSLAEVKDAFFAGRCQAYTSDWSQLTAVRVTAPGGPESFAILPELIAKEPLSPVVRRGDEEWFTLVKWVLFVLIEAEERGVTRENVRTLATTTTDPSLQQQLDLNGAVGKALGVDADWVARIVSSVGNYGEMFERNLGSQSVLRLERGLNRLWTQGGLLYAPPFQ